MVFNKKTNKSSTEAALLKPVSYRTSFKRRFTRNKVYYLFLLPGIIYFLLFRYYPMLGLRFAFFEYNLSGLGEFIGFQNFIDAFESSNFIRAFLNTLYLSSMNIVIQMTCIITISLLLNEVYSKIIKRTVQTIIYLPYFLSWVVVASVFILILSRQGGAVNAILESVTGETIYFMGDPKWWVPAYLFIMQWREVGFGTVIFLAALAGIDPQLYEASKIDGATRLQQMWHITLPHLRTVIAIVLIMNLAKIFNLFHSIFVLYNPLVYSVGDVLQTYVYRVGIEKFRFGYATAVGLFRSVIAFILVISANKINKKLRGESIL